MSTVAEWLLKQIQFREVFPHQCLRKPKEVDYQRGRVAVQDQASYLPNSPINMSKGNCLTRLGSTRPTETTKLNTDSGSCKALMPLALKLMSMQQQLMFIGVRQLILAEWKPTRSEVIGVQLTRLTMAETCQLTIELQPMRQYMKAAALKRLRTRQST